MVEKVAGTISRYIMLGPGDRVGVAVSGGADSVCLLDVLSRLAPTHGWQLVVLHLNHQLRGAQSVEDEEFVRGLAARYGFPFHGDRANLAPGNLENEARLARLAFFESARQQHSLARIATGHTLSDQAETVLFRLLRGTGPAGLTGILPVTAEGIIRPLIEVERGEVLSYLSDRELEHREDSSNQDPRFSRNRLRHDLLPALERDWNPMIRKSLAQFAQIAGDEESHWRRFTIGFVRQNSRCTHDGLIIPIAALAALDQAELRRVLRSLISQVKGNLEGVDFHHVEAIAALVRYPGGDGRTIIPGVDALRSLDWVRLSQPGLGHGEGRFWELQIPGPGLYLPPPGCPAIRVEVLEPEHQYNEGSDWLAWDLVREGLTVRSWRPGDRYCPGDRSEAVKLKTLFQEARVPLWERKNWPLLLAGDEILWSRRFGAAKCVRPDASTRRLLRITELDDQ